MRTFMISALTASMLTATAAAQQVVDLKLKSTVIATYPKEHLRAIRADTMGRLFVGAHESLLVYEPKKNGGYEPHKVLFRFPGDARISDIEVRGDHLYVLTQNALYYILDGVRKRGHVVPRKIIWGVPWAPSKDGFRALAWGPEGDLYFSLGAPCPGDRWASWTFVTGFDGAKLPYRGVGGIFRCKPDGSDLRIVAHGLRAPGNLAFDRHWNLFTREMLAKTIHLLHVTPHARLGPGFGKADGLPPMLVDAGREGPWYLDETPLPKALRQQLVMGQGGHYWSGALKPRGASFETVKPFSFPDPPGALAVGGGGRIFALVSQSEIRELTNAEDPKAHAFEPCEAAETTAARLWQELGDPSWHRRYRAHVEITRRGGDLLKAANQRLLKANADDPAFHHLIWLAAKSGLGSLHLLGLADHADPLVRVQAIRALTEYPEQLREEPIFTKALIDEHPQVQHAALLAYFSPKVAWSRPAHLAIERGPACSSDPYLRQTAALLLAQKATFQQIEGMCSRADAAMRLAGVLAAGYRLTLPPVAEPLAQHLPLEEWTNTVEYADGKVDLRERGRAGLFTLAAHWKADKHTLEQELLFKLLRKMFDDREESVRMQAARFLAPLEDSRVVEELKKILQR